jgi:hypothetical protein
LKLWVNAFEKIIREDSLWLTCSDYTAHAHLNRLGGGPCNVMDRSKGIENRLSTTTCGYLDCARSSQSLLAYWDLL